ncbi:MAG TPA: FAD-dependent monooxygenase [Gammaproteobacteria bacterium]|jgi:2-polyprenyl-6-methoxyphenol hydroxylase-like FAD-dependent oxidoreductase|nr:FAD-dependent monooxygenase [Gammaproteobacteria bacterium]
METAILIVGAGPTGLVLALWLAQFGIASRIIDKDAGPGETSRAMGVQARTLELYQQIGLANEIIEKGIKANVFNIRKNGRRTFSFQLGEMGKGLSPFPYLLSFPQDDHEKVLIEHLQQVGITVERNTELIDFSQTTEHVQAILNTKQGLETIKIAYLCGCDGAHSIIREMLKIGFPGGTYSQIFYVADVKATGEAANGEVQMGVSQQDFCLVLPVRSSGSLRLIGIVPPDKEFKENITCDDIQSAVNRDTKLTINTVNWFSTYHVHHRIAQQFKQNRIFLLGDAAHIHSPVGGQGMNTGIGDAINLAWKMAAVLQNRATADLLESYEIERISFAKQLVSSTDKAFQLMTNSGILGKCWRGAIFPFLLPLLLQWQVVSRYLFKIISQIEVKYRQSPLSQGHVNKIHGGDRLPWVKYADTDNFASLQLLDWQVHIYGIATAAIKNILQKLHLTLNVYPWDKQAENAGLQKDAMYLIRPDGYTALVCANQDAQVLENFLTRYKIISRKKGDA